jgi:general L-amino acid transport system permease protein
MNRSNLIRWGRKNLFRTPVDGLITLIVSGTGACIAESFVRWAAVSAHWSVVIENLRVFMVGTYPAELTGHAWWAGVLLCLVFVLSGAAIFARKPTEESSQTFHLARRLLPWGSALALVATVMLLSPNVMERWGGLLMSVLFTLLASALSLPLGIALALGRRSRYASARCICSGYIEVMRSLPLILVVYCIWIIVPLLAPTNPGPDLLRGLLGFTLFFAAYVAEYVRSGLQSIPLGQVEAAQSLGMSARQVNFQIVLPQALRVAIPGLVGNVLDIFNTVPLLFIIGMTDFLRAGQMILVNPQSGNRTYEIYTFMFAVYLAVASLITYTARRLEDRMSRGRQ